jgi:hypothetical protein
VTAGATVLGLVAMSGVGHADTGASTRTGSPLADLTGALTGTLDGITGALTGGGSSSSGTGRPSRSTSSPASSTSPATKTTVRRTAGTTGTGSRGGGTSGGKGTTAKSPKKGDGATTTKKKTGKAKGGKAPGHLRVEITPDLDLKRKTATGKLVVDAGLNTLLGPAGLKLEADGRLSAEDISIGDPEAEGGLKLGTRLGWPASRRPRRCSRTCRWPASPRTGRPPGSLPHRRRTCPSPGSTASRWPSSA